MRIQLLWERLALSKLTVFYFIFAVVHFALQAAFQIKAFVINQQAAQEINDLANLGNFNTSTGFAVVSPGHQDIRWCNHLIRPVGDISQCAVLWSASGNNNNNNDTLAGYQPDNIIVNQTVSAVTSIGFSTVAVATTASASQASSQSTAIVTSVTTTTLSASSLPTSTSRPAASAAPSQTSSSASRTTTSAPSESTATLTENNSDNPNLAGTVKSFKRAFVSDIQVLQNGTVEAHVKAYGNDETVYLDEACIKALVWPTIKLDNTKREDLAFLLFQAWVLGMSIVAILNESIPHVIAAFLTHLISTGWGAFQIWSSASFRRDFDDVISRGACAPVHLLRDYWAQRRAAEVPSLALNCAALLLGAFFSWRLIQQFGWQTYKRIGANLTIARVYRFVLLLSILLQFALFFIIGTVALWLDQILHGRIGKMGDSKAIFKVICIAVFVMTVPWLMSGWFGARREMRRLMLFFLCLSLIYVGGWAAMFVSPSFRWTFIQWTFFSLVALVSAASMVIAFVLAVLVRMNFGLGLPHYLSGQDEKEDEEDFSPSSFGHNLDDPEKMIVDASMQEHIAEKLSTHGSVFHEDFQEIDLQVSQLNREDSWGKSSIHSNSSQKSHKTHKTSRSVEVDKRWVIE